MAHHHRQHHHGVRRRHRRLGHQTLRRGLATKSDIDRLAGEIAKIDVQLAKVCSKLDNDNRRLNSIEQSAMRSELFAATQDRTQHEHQLEVGKRYLAAGYNGAGHVRISQLKADYSRRLASNDWDY